MTIFNKVIVTGGAGFLGSRVVALLKNHGHKDIFAVRKAEYNLLEQSEVRRLLKDHQPDLIIHSAAAIGGIGANRSEPGRYFYENVVMGVISFDWHCLLLPESNSSAILRRQHMGRLS
jgi:GDP-L-fucose synthase